MRTYNNSIVVQFDTVDSGNSGAGKLVTVFNAGTTNKADLFDATAVPIDNPVQADEAGNYKFDIADGAYDIYIDYGLPTQTSILNELISDVGTLALINDLSQTINFDDVAEYKAFTTILPVSKRVYLADRDAYFNVIAGTGTDNSDNIIKSDQFSQSLVLIEEHTTSGKSIGMVLDDSFDNTDKINAAAVRGEKLILGEGIAQATGLIPKESFIIDGQGSQHTTLKTKTVNSSLFEYDGVNTSDVQISNLKMQGLGKESATLESGVTFDGAGNSRRDSFEHVQFSDFSDYALRFSGGWGNKLDSCQITSSNIGLDFTISPQLGGWAGSGFTMYDNYFSACNIGVQMEAIWNFTAINTIIEDCVLPINQLAGGTPAVWINTWFESNEQSPAFGYSNILIGGRPEGGEVSGDDFYGNMNLPVAPFDYECITEISRGIRVFRDTDDEEFAVDGQGVKAFKPHSSLGWDIKGTASTAKQISVGFGVDALGGGIQSETSGTDTLGDWKDVTSLTAARHMIPFEATVMPQLGVKVQGQGSNSLTGLGIIRVVFTTGTYETGGAGVTESGERWEVDEVGNFNPIEDGAFDIGRTGAARVRDLRIINAPIVGSDYRIKKTPRAMSQELLDFALSVELQHFEFNDGTRSHSGVIITKEFLTALDSVMSLDSCAAFCHDVFTDDNGEPVTRMIHGVELGDLWQVRQDEWQNIMLEAMRRKIKAM